MEGSGSSKAVPQVQGTSSLPASTSPVVAPFLVVPNSIRPLHFSADCAGQQHQGPLTQQQLGMQGPGAAMSSTQGSERRTAAITQLQAKSARTVLTAKIGRNATCLLPVQPSLPLQHPICGSLAAQQGSVHRRHPRRHSPVQQGPGWGPRAPVLQAPLPNGPILPPHRLASSAEDEWGRYMTQQETMCAASDIEEDQGGLTFAID